MNQMEIETRFYEIVDSVSPLQPEQRSREMSLEGLGLDSLDMVELVQECEDEFDVEVSDEEAEKWTSLGDILEFIERNQG